MVSRKTASATLVKTAAIALLLSTQTALASVGASYTGVIDADSGLGLLGQTMRVDLTYDELKPIAFSSGSSVWYDGFIESMTVSIGSNIWVFDSNAGGSFASLHNDAVILFSVGSEDRLNFNAYTFNGPSIAPVGDPPVPNEAYNFTLGLSDNTPSGAPDGLGTNLTLPVSAPDPTLFNTPDGTGGSSNLLKFSFYSGDGETTGAFYHITTSSVDMVAVVPEPESYAMLLAGLGVVGAIARRKAKKPA